jgi:hypothetical protein
MVAGIIKTRFQLIVGTSIYFLVYYSYAKQLSQKLSSSPWGIHPKRWPVTGEMDGGAQNRVKTTSRAEKNRWRTGKMICKFMKQDKK